MQNTKYARFVGAAVIYAGFAVYLFQPYFKDFDTVQYLLVVNVCSASLGCYVLSRRWVVGFAESFFAGAIYGFGPFVLGLAKFHPTAGFLVAAIPWFFCPAAFGPKTRWRWLRVPLSALPFLATVLFFQVSAHFHLYPIPVKLKLQLVNLIGLLAPLIAAKRQMTLVGFYHVPVAMLLMGFLMFFAPLEILYAGNVMKKGRFLMGLTARRLVTMAILVIGITLAFCDSYFSISPIIWLAFTMLGCSIIAGVGMQGLVSAGFADRRWLLFITIVQGSLAIVTLLLATKYFNKFMGEGYATLFAEAAKIYLLGAIVVAIIFFIARAKLLMHPLRQVLLCTTIAMDIFLGARFIIDQIL
jgi:hypothetical protein